MGRRTPFSPGDETPALEQVARAFACLAWMVKNKGRRLERAFRERTQRRAADDAFEPGELAFSPPFWTFDERSRVARERRRRGDHVE